jgi:hypothetical protein
MDYTKEQMKLREQSIEVLLTNFGYTNNNKLIYECADEWIAKGNVTTAGLVKYYQAYYTS